MVEELREEEGKEGREEEGEEQKEELGQRGGARSAGRS